MHDVIALAKQGSRSSRSALRCLAKRCRVPQSYVCRIRTSLHPVTHPSVGCFRCKKRKSLSGRWAVGRGTQAPKSRLSTTSRITSKNKPSRPLPQRLPKCKDTLQLRNASAAALPVWLLNLLLSRGGEEFARKRCLKKRPCSKPYQVASSRVLIPPTLSTAEARYGYGKEKKTRFGQTCCGGGQSFFRELAVVQTRTCGEGRERCPSPISSPLLFI